jgi:hypothetical protein
MFGLFATGYRAENTYALYAVFGGMLTLVVVQQADIFVCRFHYT